MTDSTVAVTNGGTIVTGTVTGFVGAQGDLFILNGLAGLIDSVDSTSQLTLQQPWSGPTITGQANWAIAPTGPYWQSTVALNTQVKDLLTRVDKGLPVAVNSGGTLAHRALYDAQPQGWTFIRTDVDPALLYLKLSDASGDWSAGSNIQGDPATSTAEAIAAAALAQAWATQTGAEVVAGQGYGAKKYANDAAASSAAAAGAASTATTQAGIATGAASTATTQAGIATGAASAATTQAGIATGAASAATTQAGIAQAQADAAAIDAGIATAQAETASIDAGVATSVVSTVTTARDQALAALAGAQGLVNLLGDFLGVVDDGAADDSPVTTEDDGDADASPVGTIDDGDAP